MSTKHRERARIYHEAIKKALLNEWDPIGIKEIKEASDEYDAYVGEIHKMLIARRSAREVFDYLWWLETKHMGLAGDAQTTEQFAQRLMLLPAEVDAVMQVE